jgi:hypothetical protein
MEALCAEGLANPRRPRVMRRRPVRAWRSVDRGTCRPGYRAAKCPSGVPTLSMKRKAIPLAALARAASGPARSQNQGMYGTSMRENRESPCPPAWLITGRAAQGTPRR